MNKSSLGLYIHIPFCLSKCHYCDFCSFPNTDKKVIENYIEKLCLDLKNNGEKAKDYTVDTIYIGGGTPTSISTDLLLKIIDTINNNYSIDNQCEFTIECNPKTESFEQLKSLRENGVNRLSIGVQSAHKNELKILGRIHTFDDFLTTISDAKMAGFENISADVMFGIPEQTTSSFMQTLQAVANSGVHHISMYNLILEEGTNFYNKQNSLQFPSEEETRKMYFDGANYLEQQGYLQYEISNFAKIGYESMHNMKYWKCQPFIGFGLSAYSDFNNVRSGNSRDITAYLQGQNILSESENISQNDRKNEYVMLGFRLNNGINIREYNTRFQADFIADFGKALEKYIPMGLVGKNQNNYFLTREGMYVSNSILSDILAFDKD